MTDPERSLIEAIRGAVDYWRGIHVIQCDERLSGVAHSILTILDGVVDGQHVAYDLVGIDEHGTEKHRISTMLHELLYADSWR